MAWSGHISFGPGWAAYRGAADQQSPHAHSTLQLVVAESGDAVVEMGAAVMQAPGILLAPRIKHLTRPAGVDLTFIYAEPQAPLGRYLLSLLGQRKAVAAESSDVAAVRTSPSVEDVVRELARKNVAKALDRRLSTALVAIEANIGARTAVALAARAADLSVSRLRAVAQTELGMPLAQWIILRKLALAGLALSRGETLAGAAASGGFADQAHLTRTMRRTFGVTPGVVAHPLRGGRLTRRPRG